MNATPPASGHRAARVQPHGAVRAASHSPRLSLALRRAAIGLAAFALALLTGAACALSFEDLRQLAIAGRANPQLAYLYPAAFDILLVVALVCVPLLHGVRLLVRSQAGFILLLLLLTAAGAAVAGSTEAAVDPHAAAVVVALFPWVTLVLGLWLLLLLLKHARTNRADLDDDDVDEAADAEDFVPFEPERTPNPVPSTAPAPVQATAADPAGTATAPAADETTEQERPQAVGEAVRSCTATTPGTDAAATAQGKPPAPPARQPTAAQPSAEVDAAQTSPDSSPLAGEKAGDRPVRWGDLVRPRTDVLVRSKRTAAATSAGDGHASAPAEVVGEAPSGDPSPASEDESGAATQPLRRPSAAADPPHAEQVTGDVRDDADAENVPLAPPSGRVRSTPLPPK